MKKFLFILGFGLIVGTVHLNKVEAQVRVNINIDLHPAWGPSGYNYAEYYYIPEINVYYDVIHRMFIYRNGRRWISSMYLPPAYHYYDFYSLYKVVLNGIVRPWRFNANHIHLYSGYCYNYRQIPIYYMREPHYRTARVNYWGWVEPRYMPRNSGRPVYRDHGRNTYNGRIHSEMHSPNAPAHRESVNSRNSNTNRNNATVNSRSSANNRNENSSTTTRSGNNSERGNRR